MEFLLTTRVLRLGTSRSIVAGQAKTFNSRRALWPAEERLPLNAALYFSTKKRTNDLKQVFCALFPSKLIYKMSIFYFNEEKLNRAYRKPRRTYNYRLKYQIWSKVKEVLFSPWKLTCSQKSLFESLNRAIWNKFKQLCGCQMNLKNSESLALIYIINIFFCHEGNVIIMWERVFSVSSEG